MPDHQMPNENAGSSDRSDNCDSIDSFVARVDLEKRCSAREVVEIMRSRLDGVDERVEGERVVFSRDGTDITGLSISGDHISLYVPDSNVAESYSESLGNVEREANGVRFEQLTDVNRAELRRMIDSLDRSDQKSEPES